MVEDRVRREYAGRPGGFPIGKNVCPPPSGKKINCHVFGIDTLLFESGGKHVFGIETLRILGTIFGDSRAKKSNKSANQKNGITHEFWR